jgi:chaperonin GroEL
MNIAIYSKNIPISFLNYINTMEKKFSLFSQLSTQNQTLEKIDECIKITLGPTGKNGIILNKNQTLNFITSGSNLLKALEFSTYSGNILVKLFEQAALKTKIISGDGSTTTILLTCELLKSSLPLLVAGYNSVFLSNGLKKLAFFLNEKILEYSTPVSNFYQLSGIIETSLGKRVSKEIVCFLQKSISQIGRDGLLLVEENISEENEIELVQGIELDKGFASAYFVNDLKNFETIYENPYLLIANSPITSLNQIREIIEHIKLNNRSLVLVVEEINKDILSTLVLNNIQKKIKVVVIKYNSIKFMKNGILEDLALLSHSNYFESNLKNSNIIFSIDDLGQLKKVIIGKEKSTFMVSKFARLIANRRINELNRELLTSESEYEKNIFKTRIARLSGHIAKIKLGVSNKYQIDEIKQKVESLITNIKASLEEGILPGGGCFYIYLQDEVTNWSYLNLLGEEIFASNILLNSLLKPFSELCSNTNIKRHIILESIKKAGYPFGYNLLKNEFVSTLKDGLVDSAKSIRAILWNSLTIVSIIITSE